MQRSNSYILMYTVALTLFCGIVLSLTAMALKPRQKANIEQERKISIVATFVDTKEMSKDEAVALYNEVIEGVVVNSKGEVLEGKEAGKIEVLREYKKSC